MVNTLTVKPTKGFTARGLTKKQYAAVEKGTAEKFGRDSPAYQTIMNGVNPENGTGSQYFFNTEAGLYLPATQRVIGLKDAEQIHTNDQNFFSGFYTDTTDLVLRTSTPSWERNAHVLEGLVSQVQSAGFDFSSEKPLLISGVEFVEDTNTQNHYGLQIKLTDDSNIRTDERFATSKNEKNIKFGEGEKTVWTKEKGLSRVCLSRGGSVDSLSDSLAGSGGDGQVVVFDADGVAAENFDGDFTSAREKYHAELAELRKRIDEELRQ